MRFTLRTLLAVITGMALALVLVVAVELFSAVVYPFPAGFDGNVPEHVRHYPHWVLGIVVLAWGATSAAATGVASRIGGMLAGAVVAVLLAWALAFNLTMLPYPAWFKIAMFLTFPIVCLLGINGSRPQDERSTGAPGRHVHS
jgi:xanthine/uracil permease